VVQDRRNASKPAAALQRRPRPGSARRPHHPETGERGLSDLRWELIRYWSKDRNIGWKCINARGETARTAPAFRSAYMARRCLVPANAFYEWRANGKTKQPYAIRSPIRSEHRSLVWGSEGGDGRALLVQPNAHAARP